MSRSTNAIAVLPALLTNFVAKLTTIAHSVEACGMARSVLPEGIIRDRLDAHLIHIEHTVRDAMADAVKLEGLNRLLQESPPTAVRDMAIAARKGPHVATEPTKAGKVRAGKRRKSA